VSLALAFLLEQVARSEGDWPATEQVLQRPKRR
jgi:hypothetical protein